MKRVLVLRYGRRHRLGHRQANRPWVIRHRNLHWASLHPLVINLRMRVVLMTRARYTSRPKPSQPFVIFSDLKCGSEIACL